ncbi:MAG: hypothetical protein NTU73_09975 [Ignavibacteriae bacterium]|nr:hypothetical protein [Ignavibacteriota bacterium]
MPKKGNKFDRFVKKYRPIKNFVCPTDNYDGYFFDTMATEMAVVKMYNPKYIFTLMECEGKTFLSAGIHFVNRLGYFIVGKKWENKEEEIEI